MVIPKSDFDFESSNAKFSKDDLLKEFVKLNVQDGPNTEGAAKQPAEEKAPVPTQAAQPKELEVVIPPPQAFYNKKASFFDDISCEIKERMASASTPLPFDERRHRIQEERRLNVETFGQAQSHRYNRYGNRGGYGYRQDGRGRGYRGRGRGRGRGGYYGNQSYNQPPPSN
ncbi:hypothetical protein IWQ62_001816 [Dispira parvispora]|uniref:Uncharacterized protein n=1 Tax=Dispira parvispora TaxID=1520584 RepID=A0A9W8E853_9FUNG|nr:hypothetical protein IWQ62_001816 [Dispira parvispora]